MVLCFDHNTARRGSLLLSALAALCALALSLAAPTQAAPCETANATPAKTGKRAIVRATLCTINSKRAEHGQPPLRLNRRLSSAATAHAVDMNAHNYFAHDSLDGRSFVDRIRRAGYLSGARRWTIGENLAWGSHERSAPGAITQMWMRSPGHRANILSSAFREIGIGVADGAPVAGGGPAAIYATSFGAKS